MSTLVEMIEALEAKWNKAETHLYALNATEWELKATDETAAGVYGYCARELAPILAAAREQERELAEAISSRDSWHEQWKLRCGMLDKQVEITEKLEQVGGLRIRRKRRCKGTKSNSRLHRARVPREASEGVEVSDVYRVVKVIVWGCVIAIAIPFIIVGLIILSVTR